MPRNIKISRIIVGLLFFSVFFCQKSLAVSDEKTVNLNLETIQKGYTILSADSQLKLGFLPNAADKAVTVSVNTLSDYPKLPADTKAVSKIYEFSVTAQGTVNLSKALHIALNYQTENHTDKILYYYSQSESKWLPFVSWTYVEEENLAKGSINLLTAKIAVLEKSAYRLRIDQNTVAKGYTVEYEALKVGVVPNAVDQPVTIVLKPSEKGETELPDGLAAISDYYTFEIKSTALINFQKPVILIFKTLRPDDHKKKIYVYDGIKKEWVYLPSQTIDDGNAVRANIHVKFAKIVVLEDVNYMEEGQASWFRSSKHPYGAASNDYENGTMLKVTNRNNGKSVEVEIFSTGPFVPGRIIDITYDAFKAIADPYYDGVINVIVEESN